MWTAGLAILLQYITVSFAFTTPSIWPAADPGLMAAGGGSNGHSMNDFMNWGFGGPQMVPTTPAPMVTYHTAVQAPPPVPLGVLQSGMLPPMGLLAQITQPQQTVAPPAPPTQTTQQTTKADSQYTMEEWLKFVAAGVAAAAVQQNMSPSEVQAQVLAAFGGAKTTETTTATTSTTTTTTQAPTTTAKKALTLGELIVNSLGLNKKNETKDKGKKPVEQEKRGCHFKGQWYKPSSEIERGQSGTWCYGTYCNHASVVIHWDDHKCNAPLTTPPVFNKKETSSADSQSMSSQQQAIFSMFGNSHSVLGQKEGRKRIPPRYSSSTTTTTENPPLGCIYNGRWFAPGTDIENLRDYGRCYGSFCDFKSKIIHWSDRCRGTVTPFTQPPPTPPTQSMQSMQRQMQQLESLLKK